MSDNAVYRCCLITNRETDEIYFTDEINSAKSHMNTSMSYSNSHRPFSLYDGLIDSHLLMILTEDLIIEGEKCFMVGVHYNSSAMKQLLVINNETTDPHYFVTDSIVDHRPALEALEYMNKTNMPHDQNWELVIFMAFPENRHFSLRKLHILNSFYLESDESIPSDYFYRLSLKWFRKTLWPLVGSELNKLDYESISESDSIDDEDEIGALLTVIRSHTGTRYYNITTRNFINSSTVKKMAFVNHKFKVVAHGIDKSLFDCIISFLDADDNKCVNLSSNSGTSSSDDYMPTKRNDLSKRINSKKSLSSSSDVDYIPARTVKNSKNNSNSSSKTISTSDSSEEQVVQPKQNVKPKNASQIKRKRKNIPAKVRQMTWRKYMGNSMDGKCWCCGDSICFENWHAGHVHPSSKGGPDSVENLRPLCSSCNLSMSNKHMADFIKLYHMKGPGAEEFSDDIVNSFKSLSIN